jgi:phage terminase large subunit-like protein
LLPASQREEILSSYSQDELAALEFDWRFWGRPKQIAPPGDWATWILRAGRGFGKTRTGAEWFHERAAEHPGRWMALVAKTPADARDYCIEGPGGLLRNCKPKDRPHYESSKRRITWPNGSWATVYSSEEADQLRGFSGDTAWLDELAKYPNPQEVWDNLQFGMREASSDRPRRLITSTPRPLPIIRQIEKLPGTIVVTGSSYENRGNLDRTWFNETIAAYEGTRFGRQEIHAEILNDIPGALWSRDKIDECRLKQAPDLSRIVIAIDPAASSEEKADESGIVVAGVDGRRHGFVLQDATMKGTPQEVCEKAVRLFWNLGADRIVAEVNNGGEWIEAVLRSVDPTVPYRAVRASRGKVTRAEPVSSFYERGLVHHVGSFPQLEDQMCEFTVDFDRKTAGYSPDRVDALVWAFTELMVTGSGEPGIRSLG